MTVSTMDQTISAEEHAQAMEKYIREGTRRARELGNRGPIKRNRNGDLETGILDAYWDYGFYVFEDVVGEIELAELRADVERMLDGAPTGPKSNLDAKGRPANGQEFTRPAYRFAKPLSDPLGGTTKNKGRHPVGMANPTPAKNAPAYTVQLLHGNLHLMESTLRLYGHPGLLAVAEATLGPDFVPYNEVTFIKEPGLGPSVAWHQDGTTHWESPDWNHGAHGFNFMTQLYPSTAANSVWILPGSHKVGKVDIRKMVKDAGSDRIEGAIPLLCESGDAFLLNRQVVHGSFANTSDNIRVTINAGFHRRASVLGVRSGGVHNEVTTYDDAYIRRRARLIQYGVDARRQRFPHETPYAYAPLADSAEAYPWNAAAKADIRDYNLQDIGI